MSGRSRRAAVLATLQWAAVFLSPVLLEPAPSRAEEAASIPLEEVSSGQRGYGLSVFRGTQAERFDVEVIGVLRNAAPGASFIMARLSGQGLEESAVVAGMSGSPVYLDGRLAGAVAFGWPFSREALAGITPIADMRRMAEAAAVPAAGRGSRPAAGPLSPLLDLQSLLAGQIPPDLLSRSLARLRPSLPAGTVPSVQWLAGGLGPGAVRLLEAGLGPISLAGEAAGGAGAAELEPGDLAPGDMVAAVLLDGDLRLAVSGTVTERAGERVLAFGHPFLGAGPISVPMARAEVVTVVKSLNSSFKLSNLGPVVGAFVEDRRAGLLGQLGRAGHTMPLSVRIVGETERQFSMRLAELPGFTASLLASAVVGSIEAVAWRSGEQGIDLEARFALRGHGSLAIRQSFDGPTAALEGASLVLAVADFLLENDLEEVTLDEVEVTLSQVPSPRTATVVGAHAEHTVVRPGDRVRLNVDLVAFRGEPFRRSLAVDLPHDLPAGRYFLLVGDGSSVDAARLAAQPSRPVNFRQALALLSSLHSRRDLVVLGLFGGRGLSVAGQPMPRLPGTVRSLWEPVPSGGAVPLKLAVAQERVERLDGPIAGIVRVDLEVQRREPLVPAEAEGGGPEQGAPAAPPGQPEPASEPPALPPPPNRT
jgi:hypothetical protein